MENNVSMDTIREQMKMIIRKYLNTIVYIDDKFDLSLVGEEIEQREEKPKRSSRKKINNNQSGSNTVNEDSEKIEKKDKLSFLLERMQRRYPFIKLQPVKYTNNEDKSYVEMSVKSSKLVVIDWKLSEGKDSETQDIYTAVDVIKLSLTSSNQMRLLVVYTSEPDDAVNDFITKQIITKFDEGVIQGNKYKYAVQNSSIIMLCKKDDFNAQNLIDAYADLIIKEFGYFPVAFLDMLLKIDSKVGILLKKFSQPFDSILLMQLENSGVEYSDNTELLRDLVTNSVYDEINCDPCIVDNMYKERISSLIALADLEDDQLDERRNKVVDYMLSKCSKDDKKVYKVLKNIPVSDLKQWLREIDVKPENWHTSLYTFQGSLINKSAEIHAKNICQDFLEVTNIEPKSPELRTKVETTKKSIELNIFRSVKGQVSSGLSNITSFFLMLLCEIDVGAAINNLITNLKLKSYTEEDEVAEIITQNLKIDLEGKIDEECKETMKNKLFPGDILFKENAESSYDFLICITPSCQMFRPHKVDYVLSYVKGEMLTHGLIKDKKDSEHISIIPHPSLADKLIGVKWKFHEIKQFDLKSKEGRDEMMLYKRLYRLTDDYYRQMTSEFNAFYGKVGVEDLFIKSSPQLSNFFLR